MSDKNTVTVIIYGQEYTLSGDMPREYIMKLADKVDAKMRELQGVKGLPLSKSAVLAAMLLADDLLKSEEEKYALIADNENAKRVLLANYEEEKRSIAQRYEERLNEQKELLDKAQEISPEVQKHIDELEEKCRDIESSFFDLQMENIRLKNEIENYKRNSQNQNSYNDYSSDNF